MDDTTFLSAISSMRSGLDLPEFTSAIVGLEPFGIIVSKILENNVRWADQIGIGNTDVSEDLTEEERFWKKYFIDHSFGTPEEARNFSDAMSHIVKVDLNRLLTYTPRSKSRFPGHLCIVPRDNDNGHSYKIGHPILSLSTGSQFFKENAESGNSMSASTNCYRMATVGEIAGLVASLMYRSTSITEDLVYGVWLV